MEIIIYRIKEYLEKFDGFKGKLVSVDCDEFETSEIVISPVPERAVIKKYADGGEIRQFVFSVNFKTESSFSQNRAYILEKDLEEYISKTYFADNVLYFEISESCHLKKATAAYAEYQMNLRLVYTA